MDTCETWAELDDHRTLLVPVFRAHAQNGPQLSSFRAVFSGTIKYSLVGLPPSIRTKSQILERRIKEHLSSSKVEAKESPPKVSSLEPGRRYTSLITAFERERTGFICSAQMQVIHLPGTEGYAPAYGIVQMYFNPAHSDRTGTLLKEISGFIAHSPIDG